MREYVVGYWVSGSPHNIITVLAETAEAAFADASTRTKDLGHDPAQTRIKVTTLDGRDLIYRPADVAPTTPAS